MKDLKLPFGVDEMPFYAVSYNNERKMMLC